MIANGSVSLPKTNALSPTPGAPGRQLSRGTAPSQGASTGDGSRENLFLEYISIFRRYRGRIALFAIAGCLLGILATVAVQPVYQTRTSLDIQGVNGDFLNIKEVSRTGGAEAAEVNMQTQIKLLQSDTLLSSTSAAVLADPHPETLSRTDMLSRSLRAMHLKPLKSIPFADALLDTATTIKVKPLGLTRLVEVSCTGVDPALAATFCNRLITEFGREDIETRSDEAQHTSEWLTRQLADVKQKALDSQRKLEEAVGGNGLMLSQATNSTGEERLRELQGELVKAQSDRMQREADQAQARIASPDTVPEALDNPTYRQYEARLTDLRTQLAALIPPATEENPKVIHLRSEIRAAESGLTAARAVSTGRQTNELSAARHREDLLQVAYNAQLATVSSDLQKAAQVSLLKRELDSEQQLYQTMMQRAKEAGFASAMQASTVRVVDPARKPLLPTSPRPAISGAGGLALGTLCGIGFFFYRERTIRVFRLPGEAANLLRVEELGVIPHALASERSITSPRARLLDVQATNKNHSSAGDKALELTRWDDRFSVMADAYRSATFSILLLNASKGSRVYALSSPSDGEGKTTVTSNLGVALSKSRRRVLLIDGDLRKPRLHRVFNINPEGGLRDLLRGDIDLLNAPLQGFCKTTNIPNLHVMPAGNGSENSVELLHSPNMSRLLERLTPQYDLVLIDTPPMLHMADARILAGFSDGVILVFRAGSTTVQEAQAARDLLERDGVTVAGTILNDFSPQTEGLSSYYSSYQRYGEAEVGR